MKLQAPIIGILLGISAAATAQTDGFLFNYMGLGASTALVTDYQTIGVNPANLGLVTQHNVAFEIGGAGFSLFSDGLPKSALRDFSFGNTTEISIEEQLAIAKDLMGESWKINLIYDYCIW